jgi:hypothetical protein
MLTQFGEALPDQRRFLADAFRPRMRLHGR